jgi:hypothetical protein
VPFDRKLSNTTADDTNEGLRKLPQAYFWFVITCGAMLLSIITSLEEVGSLFLSQYLAKSAIQMGEDKASAVVALEAFSFTIGRLINLFASRLVPTNVLNGSAVLLVIGGYTLLSQLGHGQHSLVLLSVIIAGNGEAPIYPLTMSFIEKRATITNTVQMIIQLTATVVTIFSIHVIGDEISNNPSLFIVVSIGFGASMAVMFVLLVVSDWWKARLLSTSDQMVLVH